MEIGFWHTSSWQRLSSDITASRPGVGHCRGGAPLHKAREARNAAWESALVEACEHTSQGVSESSDRRDEPMPAEIQPAPVRGCYHPYYFPVERDPDEERKRRRLSIFL